MVNWMGKKRTSIARCHGEKVKKNKNVQNKILMII